ncbi:uncharacterized protein LOC132705353 isoform X3 [Cylas formicarius]|uniref:uncharacterized protein LOC132705353 isoform X3 n=1 Tax=Cylas formicarius TaxID=197179 RepID=UPI0029583E1E|nr:uncharacterized protein LOC132705353 isoform X3 [Cylas formicarius]
MDQIFQWLILFCGINNFHISGGAVVNPDRPFQLEHKQSNLFLNENLKFVESKQQAATFMLESYSSSRRTDRYIKEVKSGKVFDRVDAMEETLSCTISPVPKINYFLF